MSGLYRAVFGINSFAPALLGVLDLDTRRIPRWRDAVIKPGGERIVIYTRTGGPRRAEHAEAARYLTANPHYDLDRDDAVDATYAHYEFRIPPQYAGMVAEIAQQGGIVDIEAEWRKFLTAMANGWDTPETRRAKELAREMMNSILTGKPTTNPNVSLHRIPLDRRKRR